MRFAIGWHRVPMAVSIMDFRCGLARNLSPMNFVNYTSFFDGMATSSNSPDVWNALVWADLL